LLHPRLPVDTGAGTVCRSDPFLRNSGGRYAAGRGIAWLAAFPVHQ
jgi:hypothetical protein